MTVRLPDVPQLQSPALFEFLQAVKRSLISLSETAVQQVTTPSTGGGGSSGGGSTVTGFEPPSFVHDFNGIGDGASSNDAAFGAVEAATASTVHISDGTFVTSLNKNTLHKRYYGEGVILAGADALPARFAYMNVKPTTWPVQGQSGWFRGDQKFTDGGEWKIIGAGVRTYDPTARYFESNVIPHHAWFDVESGSSGINGLLTSGAAAGAVTVGINGAAQAEWIGKQVSFSTSVGGATVETKVVQSVAGSTITLTTPLANTYTWNPAAGQTPCIYFAPRTWGGFGYTRVRHRAGGDGYGHIVRMQVEYQPKPAELAHTFYAATGGQYGGDVNFIAGSSGTYATGWESQYTDQGNDVAVIAQVDSFNRTNDTAAGGGRGWLGTLFKSEGTRAADAAHVVAGAWRYGLDTARAAFKESTVLNAVGNSGANTVTVKSAVGARNGDPIIVGTYAGTITSVVGAVIGVSPNLNATFAAGTYVEFPTGGAIINAALGQKIIWNSTVSNTGRSGDPLAVFAPLYSNVQGDIETGTATDAGGDFWYTKFNQTGHAGASARIRLRPTSFQVNVELQAAGVINAAKDLVTNAYSDGGPFAGAVVFGAGLGHSIRFNTSTNKFEFYRGGALVGTIP